MIEEISKVNMIRVELYFLQRKREYNRSLHKYLWSLMQDKTRLGKLLDYPKIKNLAQGKSFH